MDGVFALQALPPEIQQMIFFEILKLPPIEVLRCRMVCKRWKEAVDSLRYDELTIERQNNSERNTVPRYDMSRS